MWILLPELLVPMVIAFVVGSLLAWAVVGMVLPREGRKASGSEGGV